jgi:hypothetical protein
MKPKNYSNPIKSKTKDLGEQFILDIPYDQI